MSVTPSPSRHLPSSNVRQPRQRRRWPPASHSQTDPSSVGHLLSPSSLTRAERCSRRTAFPLRRAEPLARQSEPAAFGDNGRAREHHIRHLLRAKAAQHIFPQRHSHGTDCNAGSPLDSQASNVAVCHVQSAQQPRRGAQQWGGLCRGLATCSRCRSTCQAERCTVAAAAS